MMKINVFFLCYIEHRDFFLLQMQSSLPLNIPAVRYIMYIQSHYIYHIKFCVSANACYSLQNLMA